MDDVTIAAASLTGEHIGRWLITTSMSPAGELLAVEHGGQFVLPEEIRVREGYAIAAGPLPRQFTTHLQLRVADRPDPLHMWTVGGLTFTIHAHVDVGGGYCACGAQRCSLPTCDGYCVHPDGWLSHADVEHRRQEGLRQQLQAVADLPLSIDAADLSWPL